jgi:hypothetical protein
MRRTMTTENRSTDVSPHSAIRFNRKKRKKNARWPDPKKCLSSSHTHTCPMKNGFASGRYLVAMCVCVELGAKPRPI